jgi:hypothetical protein
MFAQKNCVLVVKIQSLPLVVLFNLIFNLLAVDVSVVDVSRNLVRFFLQRKNDK